MAECPSERKSKMPNKSGITWLIPVFIVCVVFVILWRRHGTEHFVTDLFESIDKPTSADFQNRVCTNQDCVSVAALIIQNMDHKADPCNDTVAFACGNYKFHHDRLKTEEMSPSYDLGSRIERQLVPILTTPPSSSDKPWHALTKWYYQKCINKPDIDATAKKALLALLEEIGGWPLLDPHWTEFATTWEEYIAMVYRKFNIGAVVTASVGPNPANASDVVLQLHPGLYNFLPSFLNSTALFLGAEDGSFNRDLDTFSHMHTNLQTSLDNSNNKDVVGPLYLVQQKFPNFNVEKYVRAVVDGIVEVSPNTTVVVNNKGYFANLHKIISSKRDLANYVAGLVVMRFQSEAINIGGDPSSSCYLSALTHFTSPITQLYVQNSNFDEKVRAKVTEMIVNMKEFLQDMIRDATWLDEETRQNALKKAGAMEYSIGYPENLYTETVLRQRYNIAPSNSSESFYSFISRIFRQDAIEHLSRVGQPVDRISYSSPPVTVNAVYDYGLNKFFLHVAYMQLPYFSTSVPDYVNYAGLGATVGHEILHGFDPDGRDFDHDGLKRNWWTNNDTTDYEDKMECFIKQYDDYGIDGRQTLQENIADNVGLMLAYNAYKKKLSKHPGYVEPALPGLEKFTLDQIFFITVTSTLCGIDPVTDDDPNASHPPEKLRAYGPLQNMVEYSVAFNCSKDSEMNPTDKCSIW